MILVPLLYMLLLYLCLNSVIANPGFIIFSMISLYTLNFILLIQATTEIQRKNDVDRYYKCNE